MGLTLCQLFSIDLNPYNIAVRQYIFKINSFENLSIIFSMFVSVVNSNGYCACMFWMYVRAEHQNRIMGPPIFLQSKNLFMTLYQQQRWWERLCSLAYLGHCNRMRTKYLHSQLNIHTRDPSHTIFHTIPYHSIFRTFNRNNCSCICSHSLVCLR